MKNLPASIRPDPTLNIRFGLPVWHGGIHEEACRSRNSLKYHDGVGRTDGEGIERKWAATNEAARAAAEMTPGGHQEYLDDVLGFQNYKKVINLGTCARSSASLLFSPPVFPF